jgi:EmrB/QacA subfamily drug resistance transporter
MTSVAARRSTLAASILGSSIAFLDTMVVVVALPRIASDLGLGLAAEQWVLLAYSLPLAALYLVAGAIGDRRGHRQVFVAGVVGFAAASALAGIAPSGAVLIVARVLQGAAGAFVTTNSLALLRAEYGESAGRAIGLWTSFTSAATLIAPPLGGAIAQYASWRWIFFLNLPLAFACVAFASRGRSGTEAVLGGRIDRVGAVAAAVGLGGVTYALVEGPSQGIGAVWWSIVLAAVGFAAFWAAERRSEEKLLPLPLFRERNFAGVSVETFFVYAAISGVFTYLTLYLQFLGFSPLGAGLAELPVDVVLVLFGSLVGTLAGRYGPRAFLTAAPVLIAGAAASFAFVQERSDFWGAGIVGIVLLSVGLAILVAPITTTALSSAPPAQAGTASGVNSTISRIGSLFAVALLGAVATLAYRAAAYDGGQPFAVGEQDAALRDASVHAFRAVMVGVASFALVGALVGAAWISNRVDGHAAP